MIDEAQAGFIQWQKSIPSEIGRAWGNWTMPILNYFNHPVTNDYTESLNSLIRVMNRLGRGYSFEALRARILFAEEGAHKHKLSRPKLERKERLQAEPEPVMGDSFASMVPESASEPKSYIPKSTEPEKPDKNYGADISILIRMIENGEL